MERIWTRSAKIAMTLVVVACLAALASVASIVGPQEAYSDTGDAPESSADAVDQAPSPDSSRDSLPTGDGLMYRLYNPYTGEHFYTASVSECDNVRQAGWTYEGIGWTAPETSNTPVYRLYNPYAGEHHYCMSEEERNSLIAAGWADEGIGWYSDDAQGMPLYREYNPYMFSCNHNYTADKSEHDNLVILGWVDEGYAWYGLAVSDDSAAENPEEGGASEGPSQEGSPEGAPAQDNPSADATTPESPAADEPAGNVRHASVKVQGYDEFVIDVDMDNAPITAENFCKLVEDGYYNGLAFYRIAEGFCLQGGTKGNTASGNDPDLTPIVGEFSANGHDNPLADDFHKGTVAMARTAVDMNSATSTFFIALGSSLGALNSQYAAFGTIDEAGMQIVDSIVEDYKAYATGAYPGDDSGAITDSSHMPIIESITIAK